MRLAAAATVALVAAVILFPNLGRYGLWDPDEGRHAEIARETWTATDWQGWISPRFNQEPYREKPILFYWLVSAAYAVAGPTAGAARGVSAFAAFLLVLAVWVWATRVWDPWTAAGAAIALVTSVEFAALGR